MSKFNRIHLVVLDSVGIGAAPDANNFVNAGVPDGASDTLGHISKTVGLNVPNMAKIGLGNILTPIIRLGFHQIQGVSCPLANTHGVKSG